MIEEQDDDKLLDIQSRNFLEELRKIGPFSKQILNYSYPPLLYQRGDDDDEEEEDGNEDDEKKLPDYEDSNDQDINDLINGSGMNEQLFNKLNNVIKEKGVKQYVEQEDEDGNLYLVGADDDDDDDEADEN